MPKPAHLKVNGFKLPLLISCCIFLVVLVFMYLATSCFAIQGHKAINVFKTLMSHGYRPNDVTCTIMIDCCSINGSFKSAQGLIAMMIRQGYPPQTQTYTALIKVIQLAKLIYLLVLSTTVFIRIRVYDVGI